MANLKELNVKITSLHNTQKLTKTMKLVAASKMRRAQQAQEHGRAYAERLEGILGGAAASHGRVTHPLLETRDTVRRALILFIVSDRGLCAGFNNNLCRYTARWIEDHKDEFQGIDMSFCGRRGHTFFRNRVPVRKVYEGATDRPRYETAATIADELMADFTGGDYDRVLIAYNRYRSTLSQVPTLEVLLPVTARESDTKAGATHNDYLFEPPAGELLAGLLPDALRFRVFEALLENAAGEHAARMTAMDSATRNAGDMIKLFTLKRNRERQAAITTELIEIVTGAESL
jgi:F-type H+-transporting ATPase subunit gamma